MYYKVHMRVFMPKKPWNSYSYDVRISAADADSAGADALKEAQNSIFKVEGEAFEVLSVEELLLVDSDTKEG